jgi:hypothetical protein
LEQRSFQGTLLQFAKKLGFVCLAAVQLLQIVDKKTNFAIGTTNSQTDLRMP